MFLHCTVGLGLIVAYQDLVHKIHHLGQASYGIDYLSV